MRKKTTQEKKATGSFNVTRDKDRDFQVLDGLMQMIPQPPRDFTEYESSHWQRAWRHLVKHQYGKEIDFEIVEAMVREYSDYQKYRPFDHTKALAQKAFQNYISANTSLCLNPNALGRAALLQKQNKKDKLKDAITAATGS